MEAFDAVYMFASFAPAIIYPCIIYIVKVGFQRADHCYRLLGNDFSIIYR